MKTLILFATLFLSACDPALDHPPLLQTDAAAGHVNPDKPAPRVSAAVSLLRVRG